MSAEIVPLSICPITIKDATVFVRQHHRHLKTVQHALFAVAVTDGAEIHGVAIVGLPTARLLDDGWTVEVRRLTTDGARNACSMLYGACWRAARALGWRRCITYTLATEPGTSLRAAGWRLVGDVRAQRWSRPSRPRVNDNPAQAKLRWEA